MIVLMFGLFAALFVTPSWRRISPHQRVRQGSVDQAVILDMAAAALKAGIAIPAMLQALHAAMDDPAIAGAPRFGRAGPRWQGSLGKLLRHNYRQQRSLAQVANMLLFGAPWEEAWEHVLPIYSRLGVVLAPAWKDGVAPVALLERSAQGLRYSRARRAKEAAGALGSKLVVPLAACFLPAFMLLGVLPVVIAAASKLF